MNRAETLALLAKGKEAWNAWASGMLAEKQALGEKSAWIEHDPRSEAAMAWLNAARADFSGHRFSDAVDFSDFVFPGQAQFGPAVETANNCGSKLRPVSFDNSATFNRTAFLMDAVFEGAVFRHWAWLDDTIFSGNALFSGTIFEEYARFNHVKISGSADFSKATFNKEGSFFHSVFMGQAIFDDANFEDRGNFCVAQFGAAARFDNVIFCKSADFPEATFSKEALFRRSRIEGHGASFVEAQFEAEARFDEAVFDGMAWFQKAKFAGEAEFRSAAFSGAWFKDVSFAANAIFDNARFGGYTTFERARFKRVASFTSVQAQGQFLLGGASFREMPDFDQAEFRGEPKPDMALLIMKNSVTRVYPSSKALQFRSNPAGDAAEAIARERKPPSSVPNKRAFKPGRAPGAAGSQSKKRKPEIPAFYEMSADYRRLAGWKLVNWETLQRDWRGLGPPRPWPDGYLQMPRGPWLLPEYVEVPRFLIAKKFGSPIRDLESIEGIFFVSAAMKTLMETVDSTAFEFRCCETVLHSGQPGRETWLCAVTRAFAGAVDEKTSVNLRVGQGPDNRPSYSMSSDTRLQIMREVIGDAHVFHIAEMARYVFCDQVMREAYRESGLTGILFRKVA